MSSLEASAAQFHSLADDLLIESQLLSVLDMFGTTEISGSYSYNLMMVGDIDIRVETPTPHEAAQNAMIALMQQDYWRSCQYFDWQQFRRVGFPEGYYVGLSAIIKEVKFKIDIWFVTSAAAAGNRDLEETLRTLSPEKRELILASKKLAQDSGHKIESYAIYQAVLREGIERPEDVLAYLQASSTLG
jgi:hypothetical protein